jgi:DNA-binding NtrC family response regulator
MSTMKKHPAIERHSATGKLSLLSVTPFDEDHRRLENIVGHSTWSLFKARDIGSTLELLKQHEIAVVLCERDLLPGTWIDLLEHIKPLPKAPTLVVTSRHADDRLWVEVLNLGAWDVLVKPFNHTEVIRSVISGWQHRHNQIHAPAATVSAMAAAS